MPKHESRLYVNSLLVDLMRLAVKGGCLGVILFFYSEFKIDFGGKGSDTSRRLITDCFSILHWFSSHLKGSILRMMRQGDSCIFLSEGLF